MDIDLSSTSSSNTNKTSNNNLYLFFIVIGIIVIYLYASGKMENMSGGTLTQLFSNDSQDTYLKSNVDNLATGQFDLYWNQPTRIANTFLNRGSPLPVGNSVPSLNVVKVDEILNNDFNDNIDINEIANVNQENIENIEDIEDTDDIINTNSPSNMVNEINKMHEKSEINSNTQNVMKKILNLSGCSKCNGRCNGGCNSKCNSNVKNIMKNESKSSTCSKCNRRCNGGCNNDPRSYIEKCRTNPSSCGGGAGGYRLETGFVEASRLPALQKIEEKIVYPDSYVGSYFINPIPDIAQPYPVMLDRV